MALYENQVDQLLRSIVQYNSVIPSEARESTWVQR